MIATIMSMMMLIPDTKQLGGLRAKDLRPDLKSHKWAGWEPVHCDFDDIFGVGFDDVYGDDKPKFEEPLKLQW